MTNSLLDQLRRLRDEAVAQRDWATERIGALDVLIAQESKTIGDSHATAGVARATDVIVTSDVLAGGRPRSLPDGVQAALQRSDGGPLDFAQLHASVVQLLGDVNPHSLRGTLPRLEEKGLIHRPSRGTYKLGPAPQDAEGSAAATAEPSDLSGPSTEGGEGHETSPDYHHGSLPRWNDGHGGNPSVVPLVG